MAEIEEIITRYVADPSDHLKAIDQLIAKNDALDKSSDKQVQDATKNQSSLASAAQKRLQLLRAEEAELKKLEQQKKQAFGPKEIELFNNRIAQSKRNIDLLKGGTGEVNQLLTGLKGNLLGVASGIAAAFSVAAISAFAKSSVEAFKEAELNANRLKFAVVSVGGEGEDAFERLIKQSERLQGISVFSDDEIQVAQRQLRVFGLTSNEIERLIPQILDLATASGKDLAEATELVIQGINGQSRALKPLGLEFKNTGDKAQNLSVITEKLTRFQGAAAEALNTTAGAAANQANRIDDLQERLGELIATSSLFKGAKQLVGDFIDSFTDLQTLQQKAKDTSVAQVETAIVQGLESRLKLVELTKRNITQLNLTEEQAKKVSNSEELTKSAKEYILLQQDIIKNTKETAVQQKVLEELTVTLFNPDDAAQQREIASRKARKAALLEEAQALLNLIAIREKEIKGTGARLGKTDEQLAKEAAEAESKLEKQRQEAEKNRLKALEDEKRVLAEIEKIKTSTLKDPVEQLEAQAKIDNESIEQTKATQDTKDAYVKERTIKLYNDILALTKEHNDKMFAEALQAAIEQQNASSKDADDSLKKRLQIEADAIELGNRAKLAALEKGSNAYLAEQRRQLDEQRKNDIRNADVSIANEKELANQKLKINLDYADALAEINEQVYRNNLDTFIQTSQSFTQLLDIGAQYFNDRADANEEAIDKERDLQIEVLDEEEKRLKESFERKLIGEGEYQRKLEAIENRRVAANKKANDQITAQNRKAAKIAKELAIFKQSLALATAIAEENYVGAVIAAAELAATIAKPLPQFRRGTKGKQDSGFGIVGEEGKEARLTPSGHVDFVGEKGTEIRYLEKGTKITPAQQTKRYKPMFDAIIDGNIDQYIFAHYVTPQLKQERERADIVQNQSFAENIANSMVYNTTTQTSSPGLSEAAMRRVMERGTPIKNPNEVGKAIAKYIIRSQKDYRFM